MIPSVLIRNVDKLKFLFHENSTTILTGLGVSGTVATAYLTGRASVKAYQVVDNEEMILAAAWREGESDIPPTEISKSDKVKLVWKIYIPPVVVGTSTIVCIVMANRVSSKKIAALTIAGGLSERALQEYKEKVIEKFGEPKNTKIHDEIAKDRVDNDPVTSSEVIITGSGEVLCYDMLTGRYFLSTVENIKSAENKINYEINQNMYASLSEFYEVLNMKPTTYSDSVGFNTNNHCEVRFSTVMSDDNRPCIAMDFTKMPVSDYDRIRY